MRGTRACAALLASLCLLAPGASAEVYVWTDELGRTHMTDDPSQVPASFRRTAARTGAPAGGGRWNEIDGANAAVHRAAPPGAARDAQPAATGKRHVLQVQPGGREMVLHAEIDGGVEVRFVVDTGAMLNTIPRKAVRELGLAIEPDAPVTALVGIGGQPMLAPLVTVRSVRVGTVHVENVEFAVLDTMEQGLLGMPFFNRFRVQTDPASGTLTLEEIAIDGIEGIYGGLDEGGWRQQFAWLRYQRERVAAARRTLDPMYGQIHEKLEEAAAYWQAQLDQLDQKASRAGVPRAWRE
jgi:clan AA aspartic protease (TIGR02281 family)